MIKTILQLKRDKGMIPTLKTNLAVNTLNTVTAGTGILYFIKVHSSEIGICITLLVAIATILFKFADKSIKNREMDLKEREFELKVKESIVNNKNDPKLNERIESLENFNRRKTDK